jgi:hypothetical protein
MDGAAWWVSDPPSNDIGYLLKRGGMLVCWYKCLRQKQCIKLHTGGKQVQKNAIGWMPIRGGMWLEGFLTWSGTGLPYRDTINDHEM